MTGIPIAPLEEVDITCLAEFARAHWRKTTQMTLASSTTTTDMLNGEFTIDAGAMGAGRTLRLTAKVQCLYNFAGGTIALPRFSLQFGAGSAQIDTGALAAAWVQDANQSVWKIVAEITNKSTTAQLMQMDICGVGSFAAADSTLTTGNGHISTGMNGSSVCRALGFISNGSVDTTIAQALALKVKLPANNANCTCNLYDAYVEII